MVPLLWSLAPPGWETLDYIVVPLNSWTANPNNPIASEATKWFLANWHNWRCNFHCFSRTNFKVSSSLLDIMGNQLRPQKKIPKQNKKNKLWTSTSLDDPLGTIFKSLKVHRPSVKTTVQKYKCQGTMELSSHWGKKKILFCTGECTLAWKVKISPKKHQRTFGRC